MTLEDLLLFTFDNKDYYLKLKDFKDLFDISKIKSYTLEPVDDEGDDALILKFYDKDGNIINELKGK